MHATIPDTTFFIVLTTVACIIIFALLFIIRKKTALITSLNTQLAASSLTAQSLEQLSIPLWQREANGNIIYANAAYRAIIQQNPSPSSAPISNLFNDAQNIAQIALEKNSSYSERRHVIVNGERKYYEITEITIGNPPTHSIGYALDLNEIEEKDRTLKQHLSVQADLLESSRSAIAIFSADKRLRFYNNAFMSFWELDEKFLSGEPKYGEILDRLRDTRKLPEQANFQEFKRECLSMFTNLIEKKDDFFYLPNGKMLRQLVIPHEHGGLLMSYEDLTEQITQQQTYKTLVNVNKSTLDNLYEGVVVFGEDGRMQLCNPAYLRIWRLGDEIWDQKLHLQDILDLTAHLYDFIDNGELYKENLLSLITNRQASRQKLERTDGTIIDFSCVPLPDGATLMMYVDITDSALVEKSLRAEKKALEEADLIKSRFLSSISYELRSPLTSIRGFSEGLLRGYFGEVSQAHQHYLKAIYDSSVNLTNLIDNILDVASIDSGYMTLNVLEFDIRKAIDKVVFTAQAEANSKKCHLDVNCSDKIGRMTGDEKRIKQVLSNLLSNAIRFSQKDDVINFIIKTKGARKNILTFTIETTGKFLSQEDQDRVFDRFYKAPTDLSLNSGLGLTLAKSFIELHGGKIAIEDNAKKNVRIICTLKRNNKTLNKIKKS